MPYLDFKDTISSSTDIAHENLLGYTEIKTMSFNLFTQQRYADWAAERILTMEAYPLAAVKFKVHRDNFSSEPGDSIKLTFADWGLDNNVFWITDIEEESVDSEIITVSCQEAYEYVSTQVMIEQATGYASYTEPVMEDLTHVDVIEAPFVVSGDNIWIIPLAAKVTGSELGYQLHVSLDDGTSYTKVTSIPTWNPYGTLVNTYTGNTYSIDDTVGFEIDFASDMPTTEIDKLQTVTRGKIFGKDNLCLLGDEIITFNTITPVSGTRYAFSGITRGNFDTERQTHTTGTDFWYLGSQYWRAISYEQLVKGIDAKFKLVPYNAVDLGDISTASGIELSITGRAKTPQKVVNLVANNDHFSPVYSTDIVLDWSPRVRGEGLGTFNLNNAIEDETETTDGYYQVAVTVSGSTVRTQTSISNSTWTYTNANILSDNGYLPSEITFNVSAYKTTNQIKYISDAVSITVSKE